MREQLDNPLDGRCGPTLATFQARVEDLPLGMAAIGRFLLTRPGITADHLLLWAEACDEAAGEEESLICRSPSVRAWERLATILRDAAPLFPHPARTPASAGEDSAAALARQALAAGIATAGGS